MIDKRNALFGQTLDLVLFDTTTIKYWGEHSDSPLLQYGYSKEKRMDLKQIIIGVLLSKEGFPLAHEVWEGNQSDIQSLKEILRALKDKYDIRKVVLVCDRGMVSEKNLKEMEEEGYEYIVGVKMRQLDEEKKRNLLGITGPNPLTLCITPCNSYTWPLRMSLALVCRSFIKARIFYPLTSETIF